jgi:hypothetical protein
MNPVFAGDLPHDVLVLALEEDADCRLAGNLRGATPDQLELDMPMKSVFEPATEEVALVQWRPRAGGA